MNQSCQEHEYQAVRDVVHSHPNVMVCKKDQAVQQLLQQRFQARVRELQNTVLVTTERKLRHVRIPDDKGGSELAPLVAQSFIYAMQKNGHTVHFAIHNAGGVRNSINVGPISVADVAGKVLPFLVPIGVYEIKGKYIAQTLEGAIDNATNNGVVGTGSGSYPYTANLRFQYDANGVKGQRISQLEIFNQDDGWQTIVAEQRYMGTSSAYTMKGKEGYEAILNMKEEGHVTELSMADCFMHYLQDKPEVLQVCSSNRSKA